MATFITELDAAGDGPRLAVKDLIDVAGVPTTAGCRAVADEAEPAVADAPLLAGARAAGARIVGKANLHELAFGTTGINPWFGTAVNPVEPDVVPGGSSSGSAVAVGSGDADVAYGSDTGGSVRIPSACCGTAGLKTTHGRISLDGVWPLALSLDTVGPMARDVAGVVTGMQLLEPGFEPAPVAPRVVGRIRGLGETDEIAAAVDRALAEAELEVVDVELPGWGEATEAAIAILVAEAWALDGPLLQRRPDGVGELVAQRLEFGRGVGDDGRRQAEARRGPWTAAVTELLGRVELLALPTLLVDPPRLDRAPERVSLTGATIAVNLTGLPALAQPVPSGRRLPASLQLIGPAGGEELLVAAGARVEAAVRP